MKYHRLQLSTRLQRGVISCRAVSALTFIAVHIAATGLRMLGWTPVWWLQLFFFTALAWVAAQILERRGVFTHLNWFSAFGRCCYVDRC